jgi:hypothetical protein
VMPIRVEFPGYEPFVATVVPTRDTTVRVHMRPQVPESTPTSAATPPTEKRPEGAGPNTRPTSKANEREPSDAQNDVRKSGRGTFYTEKFE